MNKRDEILKMISEYITEIQKSKSWTSGKDWIQYSGPWFDDSEYVSAVETLLDGWFILGKKGRQFEIDFSKHLGKEDGIITNSGSSANLLMLAILRTKKGGNLPPGSKFITPVVCFPTTLNPILQNGFEPVFVDVTLPSLNLDLDKVEEILKADINKEIKGIIFAHVLGNPPDMDRLMKLVEEYNLIFLEDTCDALGSTWDGKPLGSFGIMSTCSFFPAHHMTTGEGGFVATNSKSLRMTLASLRDWGRACYCNSITPGNVIDGSACGNRFKSWFKGHDDILFDHRYVFDEIGYNLKPTEVQAAIGLAQLKKLDSMHLARKNNFKKLYEIFKPYEKYFYLPEKLEKADPSWFGFLVTIRDGAPFSRSAIVEHFESAKIQTRSYFTGNALLHPAYESLAQKYSTPREEFPMATKSTLDSFFLGVYPGITEEQMNYIKETLDRFMQSL